MEKKIPLISQLLKAIIVEDYASAVNIIENENFNPNEKNSSWGAPIVTAMVTVLSGDKKLQEKKNFREIFTSLIRHKDFDPNVVDSEGETVLMHIARHPEFNWMVPLLLSTKGIDLSIVNFRKMNAIQIAEAFGNNVLADILIGFKAERGGIHLPKKRVGIKAKQAKVIGINNNNSIILERIEYAFYNSEKNKPISLYALLVNFFKGNYDECIQIVKDVNFNPNECDKWEEPVLSSLIYYSQESTTKYDEESFKKIVDAIISLPKFDVNAIDADCNTTLMVSMGYPKLQWLTEKLFNISSARLDIINDMGENIKNIANNCGNGDFYNHLVMKSFETANVIE